MINTSVGSRYGDEIYARHNPRVTHSENGSTRVDKIDPVLMIGLPLIKSLWQVFQLRVNQWTGAESHLADALVSAQRKILQSLVGSIDSTITVNESRVIAIASLNAHRFHVVVFILAEAMLCDPDPTLSLDFLERVGHELSLQLVLAHNLSPARILRDTQTTTGPALDGRLTDCKSGNSFLFYLVKCRGLDWEIIRQRSSESDLHLEWQNEISSFLELFYREADVKELFESSESRPEMVFDYPLFRETIERYRVHYCVDGLEWSK
jgi:hypothetical protein